MIERKDIIAAFDFRHACKEFDASKKIPEDDFNLILEAGRLSPSSFGFEPWRFVVIQNPELRTKLKEISWGAQTQLPTSSHYVAILCYKDAMRYDSEHITRMMRDVQQLQDDYAKQKRDVFRQFQEGQGLLETQRTLFDWAGKQAYIALGNMMTVAAMRGVDSCAIEGSDFDAAEKILAEAGLMENGALGLSVMVAFGYRVSAPGSKTRQAMADIVTWV